MLIWLITRLVWSVINLDADFILGPYRRFSGNLQRLRSKFLVHNEVVGMKGRETITEESQ